MVIGRVEDSAMQPVVENAIKFGMQTSPMPLKVNINALINNGRLTLSIINSGKWVNPDSSNANCNPGTRKGLENVRKRLENAYPDKHQFSIINNENNVEIKIEIDEG